MRIYTYAPGAMPKVLEAWEKALPERVKLSPIAGCMSSDVAWAESLDAYLAVC